MIYKTSAETFDLVDGDNTIEIRRKEHNDNERKFAIIYVNPTSGNVYLESQNITNKITLDDKRIICMCVPYLVCPWSRVKLSCRREKLYLKCKSQSVIEHKGKNNSNKPPLNQNKLNKFALPRHLPPLYARNVLINNYTHEDDNTDEENINVEGNDHDDSNNDSESSDQHITPAERFEPLRSRRLSLIDQQFNDDNNAHYPNRQQHELLQEESEEDTEGREEHVRQEFSSDVSNAPTLDSAESSFVYQFREYSGVTYDATSNDMEEKMKYYNNGNGEDNNQETGKSSVFTFTTHEPSRSNFNIIGDAMLNYNGKIRCDESWTLCNNNDIDDINDDANLRFVESNSMMLALCVSEPDNVFKSFTTVDPLLNTGQAMSSLIEVSPTTASISPTPSSTRALRPTMSDGTPTHLYTCYPPFTTDNEFVAESTDAIMYNINENKENNTPSRDAYKCKTFVNGNANNDDNNSAVNNMSEYTNNGITSSMSNNSNSNSRSLDWNSYSREVRHRTTISDPVTVSSMTIEDELSNNNNNNTTTNYEVHECESKSMDAESNKSKAEHAAIELSNNSSTLPENRKNTNKKLFAVKNNKVNYNKRMKMINTTSNQSTDQNKTDIRQIKVKEQHQSNEIKCESKSEEKQLPRMEESRANVDKQYSQLSEHKMFEYQSKRAALRLITVINSLYSQETNTFALLTKELQHQFLECINVIESTLILLSSSNSSSSILHLKPDVWCVGEVGGSFATFRAILQKICLANEHEQKQWPVIFFGNYMNGCSNNGSNIGEISTRDSTHDVYIVLYLMALKVLNVNGIHLLRGHYEDFTPRRRTADECNTLSFRSACQALFESNAGVKVWGICHYIFSRLPIAAIIDNEVLVSHGNYFVKNFTPTRTQMQSLKITQLEKLLLEDQNNITETEDAAATSALCQKSEIQNSNNNIDKNDEDVKIKQTLMKEMLTCALYTGSKRANMHQVDRTAIQNFFDTFHFNLLIWAQHTERILANDNNKKVVETLCFCLYHTSSANNVTVKNNKNNTIGEGVHDTGNDNAIHVSFCKIGEKSCVKPFLLLLQNTN